MPYGPALCSMSAANTPYDFNITASGTYSTYSPWCAFDGLQREQPTAGQWPLQPVG